MQISVIGLGKLGSPLAAVLASKGHQVIGVDLNPQFVEQINSGLAPVAEPCLQELITCHRSRLSATLSYEEAISSSDATFVIVPTPSDSTGLFSNRFLLQAVERIGKALAQKTTYHLVVITSTVTPGSTQNEIRETLEKHASKSVGETLGLCYNPEFIALGSVVRNMLHPDMILIGESDSKAGDMLETIYKTVCEATPPIRRMNLINAEITKLAVNTYVTTKISYANMLSDLCDHLPDSDANVVAHAIGLDSRIGMKYLTPAIAFGGPCFPRDNFALSALAKKLGTNALLAEATQEINAHQNTRLLRCITKQNHAQNIAILGLSYKPGTYVVEESQGIQLANQLIRQDYRVSVFDPMALEEAQKELHPSVQIASSVTDCITHADIIVVLIPWPEFSLEITPQLLAQFKSQKTVIDCWRILSQEQFSPVCTLIYLGCGASNVDANLQQQTLVK